MNSPLPLPEVQEISIVEFIDDYLSRYPMFALVLLVLNSQASGTQAL